MLETWFGCSLYGPKLTVTVLEHVWVPASHTLYMKLAWPVVAVESSYDPSFGVVAITTPSRLTSMLAEVAPLHLRRDVFIAPTFFPLALSVIDPGVGVGVGVAVAVGVAVGVGVPLVTADRISTRPQPKTLFGDPAEPHLVEAI